ncbi:MAG: glycerol-3-phosphate acyltransferase [Dehalococcoidia bacterium]|nr:glycerol-3-phosphate acyltransferase [Dehalococcoidia bacterium]
MWWQTTGLVVLAYLLGSFPTAFLIGKLSRVDIRRVGSGAGGATNVWTNISRRWALVVALVDTGKGLLAVLLARWAGAEPATQWSAGLAAIAGHNWSVFMRFRGGRGLLTACGALLLLAPLQLAAGVSLGLVITIAFSTPLGALVAMACIPLASIGLGKGQEVVWASLAVFLLVVVKRLIPDQGMAAYARNGRWVLLYRLLLDRDVRDRETWVRRLSKKDTKDEREGKLSSD